MKGWHHAACTPAGKLKLSSKDVSNQPSFSFFPQGRQAVQALLWSVFAFFFTISGTNSCLNVKVDGVMSEKGFETKDGGSLLAGLFGYENVEAGGLLGMNCKAYSSEQLDVMLDGPWKAARAFGLISMACNAIVLIVLSTASCVSYNRVILYLLCGLSSLASMSLALTLLFFASDVVDEPYNGTFFIGSGMTIAGAVSSIATAIAILQIREPREAPPARQEETARPASLRKFAPPSQRDPVAPSQPATQPYKGRHFAGPARLKATADEEQPEAPVQPFSQGTETVTETILPDGSKKTVTRIVNVGGSTSVSETIVRTATSG